MTHEYKFHFITDTNVDKVIIVNDDLTAKSLQRLDDGKKLVWNGTSSENKINLLFLGGEGQMEYKFNELFSTPLTLEYLRSLTNTYFINYVVINVPKKAPQSVKLTTLQFPATLQNFFKMPNNIEMLSFIPLDKLRLPAGHQPSDYFKIGFDPQGCSWAKQIKFRTPTREFLQNITEDDLKTILDTKIIVSCYISKLVGAYDINREELQIFKETLKS